MTKRYSKASRFAQEYLIDLNATKAAERAGYSPRTAQEQGSRLLSNVMVQTQIQEAMDRRAAKLGITAERVLNELALIGFANMLDYIAIAENGTARVELSKLTREQAAAITEIIVEEFTERTGQNADGKPTFENVRRTRFKLGDKRAALVDIGRHLKLFADKVEVEIEREREQQEVKQKLRAKLTKRVALQIVQRAPVA